MSLAEGVAGRWVRGRLLEQSQLTPIVFSQTTGLETSDAASAFLTTVISHLQLWWLELVQKTLEDSHKYSCSPTFEHQQGLEDVCCLNFVL